MIYVKTIYGRNNNRKPNISKYKNEEKAGLFISTCLKWGIDILECRIISKERAENEIKLGISEGE